MERKRIGILFGMEDTFPWALVDTINSRAGNEVEASALKVSYLRDTIPLPYDLILDRISHEVPFYRTMLKFAVAQGCEVINNPFWCAADDKFFNNAVALRIGAAVPRTIVLPHKHHPPNTEAKSFRNLEFVNWEEIFDYLGFPIFLKPAYGGGWKDVYRCDNREQFFAAYEQTRDLTMMAQEGIEFSDYYRCYVLGRSRVHIMRYDPRQPHHLRYVTDVASSRTPLLERIHGDALSLCQALGYDMNTVEFAVRDGIPFAIDFMNAAPDADRHSVGQANFDWVVSNMADLLIERAHQPRPFNATGSWPDFLLRKPLPAAAMGD